MVNGPVSGGERNCVRCGKPLSRYNIGERCQACVSAGRAGGEPTGGLPLVNGAGLAELRRGRGWTQEMLAGYSGLSVEMVRKLEQGVRQSARITTLTALARALNVPVSTLLGDSPVTEQQALCPGPRGGAEQLPTEPVGNPRTGAESHASTFQPPGLPGSRSGSKPDAEPDREPDTQPDTELDTVGLVREPGQAAVPSQPTLLRHLIREHHWQNFRTFEIQFQNAAKEVGERDHEPHVASLTVSRRQWERWYSGTVKTEPHPDACLSICLAIPSASFWPPTARTPHRPQARIQGSSPERMKKIWSAAGFCKVWPPWESQFRPCRKNWGLSGQVWGRRSGIRTAITWTTGKKQSWSTGIPTFPLPPRT